MKAKIHIKLTLTGKRRVMRQDTLKQRSDQTRQLKNSGRFQACHASLPINPLFPSTKLLDKKECSGHKPQATLKSKATRTQGVPVDQTRHAEAQWAEACHCTTNSRRKLVMTSPASKETIDQVECVKVWTPLPSTTGTLEPLHRAEVQPLATGPCLN